MKNLKYLFIPFFLFVITCSFENKTLLSVNKSNYSVADFQERFQFTPNDDSAMKRERIDEFVKQMIVVEEAKAMGYEDDPVVRVSNIISHKSSLPRNRLPIT